MDKPDQNSWWTAGRWILITVLLVLAYGQNLSQMWLRWFPAWHQPGLSLYDRIVVGESYYTHGPLVPLVSLVMILLLVRHIRLDIRPSRAAGTIALAAALLLHLAASLARVNFASSLALVATLAALVLRMWGWQSLRRLWFPLAFLLFMVPLPEVTIANLNFSLKMLSASWGVSIASFLGVPIERTGPMVTLMGGKQLIIANVCNGLRTLVSLLAFGAMYAYICRLGGLWRIGLFAMAIPVAVASNALRIVGLIIVAQIWDETVATGWWHDTSGMLIFVVAFGLMFMLERGLLWLRAFLGWGSEIVPLFHGQVRSDMADGQWGRLVRGVGSGGPMVLVSLGLMAAGAWWLGQPGKAMTNSMLSATLVPQILTIHDSRWVGENRHLTDRELLILEGPAYLYRRYHLDGSADYLDYCILLSRDNRKAIHPPDLCVEGFGQGIVHKGSLVVDGIPGHGAVPCKELVVQSGRHQIYMLYTYRCGRLYTGSFWWQQIAILANGLLRRDSGGGLIRLSTQAGDDLQVSREKTMQFLRQTLPDLEKGLLEQASHSE